MNHISIYKPRGLLTQPPFYFIIMETITILLSEYKSLKEDSDKLNALISCGVAMSIAGNSRPCSGSEHLFSHALDSIKTTGAMHGEQCGVGSIMMTYLYGANWKRIRDTLRRLGAPTTAAELGVADEDVVKALELAATIRPERYTILQKLNLDYDACEKVAKTTEVIN